jgi:hypothetical protein
MTDAGTPPAQLLFSAGNKHRRGINRSTQNIYSFFTSFDLCIDKKIFLHKQMKYGVWQGMVKYRKRPDMQATRP